MLEFICSLLSLEFGIAEQWHPEMSVSQFLNWWWKQRNFAGMFKWSLWYVENTPEPPGGPFLWENKKWVRGAVTQEEAQRSCMWRTWSSVLLLRAQEARRKSQNAAHYDDARWRGHGNSDLSTTSTRDQTLPSHEGRMRWICLPINCPWKEHSPSVFGGRPPGRHSWLWPEGCN